MWTFKLGTLLVKVSAAGPLHAAHVPAADGCHQKKKETCWKAGRLRGGTWTVLFDVFACDEIDSLLGLRNIREIKKGSSVC